MLQGITPCKKYSETSGHVLVLVDHVMRNGW